MAELEIRRYTPDKKREWDEFIGRSKNATFLLLRDYMDYHSDRFLDHSLFFLKGGSIKGVMPACRIGDTLVSHSGLTYGGYIMSRKTTMEDTLHFFMLLADNLRKEGFSELTIKPVPHIYHTIPAEEDLYALFRLNATLAARNISSAIYMPSRPVFRPGRKAGIHKALTNGITIGESNDFPAFWKILQDNLANRYGVRPVHTCGEISALAEKFPENIRLYLATNRNGIPVGGTVLYITPNVVHTQYISASPEGKQSGALDLLFDHLINDTYTDWRYFDFGTSNEENGQVLNKSLICQKEGFGARAVCYDTYTLKLI